jgi:hypothetical protein
VKRTFGAIALLAAALLVSGCATVEHATPVVPGSREICVIANPNLMRREFGVQYQEALTAKGFAVQWLAADSPVATCPLSTTFTAEWSWDVMTYLMYVEFRVYQDGRPVGEAVYDARGTGPIPKKFTNHQVRIKELVDHLFPQGPV